ncbi:MAG: hypothetical protein AB1792_12060 [Candidatus Zixiibacteriota bacterium]
MASLRPSGCRRVRLAALAITLLAVPIDRAHGDAQGPVVVVPDPATDTIWVRLIFGAGSAFDPPGKEGLAHFTASALIADSSCPSGIRVLVDRDVAVFDGQCPAAAWPEYSQRLVELLSHPRLESLDAQRLIERQLAALDSVRSDDLALSQAALQYYLYRHHPYGHPPEGFDSTIRTLTVADARRFWRKHYTKGNYVLGLAGKIPSKAAGVLQKDLRALPGGKRLQLPLLPDSSSAGLSITMIERPGREWSTVALGRSIDCRRGDWEFLPLQIDIALLAARDVSKSGLDRLLRLDRKLSAGVFATVEHRPLATGIGWADETFPRQQNYMFLGTQTRTTNLAFVLNIVVRELTDLFGQGLARDDIKKACSFVIGNAPWPDGQAVERMRVGLCDLWLGKPRWSEHTADRMAQLTAADLHRAASESLDPRTLQIVAIVPDGQAFATQLLNGQLTLAYPPGVDRERIRAQDQRYLSYRPAWQVQNMRIVKAAEMFR